MVNSKRSSSLLACFRIKLIQLSSRYKDLPSSRLDGVCKIPIDNEQKIPHSIR